MIDDEKLLNTDEEELLEVEDSLKNCFIYLCQLNDIEYSEDDEGKGLLKSQDSEVSESIIFNEDNSIELNDLHFNSITDLIKYVEDKETDYTILNLILKEEWEVLNKFFGVEEEIDEVEKDDESLITDRLNERKSRAIAAYKKYAGLLEEDIITEDNLDNKAVVRCSCYLNYDYNDLKDVLLGR